MTQPSLGQAAERRYVWADTVLSTAKREINSILATDCHEPHRCLRYIVSLQLRNVLGILARIRRPFKYR